MNISLRTWDEFFKANQVPNEQRRAYLKYINKLNYKELPVVFEAKHLSLLAGIKYRTLTKMINKPEAFYKTFTIPKRSGGKRSIKAPYPLMRYIQVWILINILEKIELHSNAFAYKQGVSIVNNARKHLGKKEVLKMDIKDFFPSITINRIIPIFQNLGYSNQLSFMFSNLCCYEKSLPQGACTSPYLSNIILKRADKKFTSLARKNNLMYSRYADDLTFSGYEIKEELVNTITEIVETEGFKVNQGKTLHLGYNDKKIVTGISVSSNELKLPKHKRRKLRQEIHYIRAYGLEHHLKHHEIKDPIYLERLIGKIRFWLQIEPENEFVKSALADLKSLTNR